MMTHHGGRYPRESLLFPVQVEKENFVIQELKNHLHQVLRFSENSLLRTKQEAEKQQKADFRASQARVATVQQEILVLQSQFHNLVMENRDTEQALRKVPWGGGTARAVGPPWRGVGVGRGAGGHWGQRHGVPLHASSVTLSKLPSSSEPGKEEDTDPPILQRK